MQNVSKILMAAVVVLGLALVGVVIGRLAGGGAPKPTTVVSSQPTPSVENSNRIATSPSHVTSTPVNQTDRTSHPTTHNTHTNRPKVVIPEFNAPTNSVATNSWEAKLDQVLSSDSDDTNKVHELFAMFPTLPDDGKDEVAQHLSNLVEDEDYAPLGKLLMDPKLPEDTLDTLMADLLNRPNSTKLPMFLDIARNPDHPKHEEARDMLELYLDEDYGTDWTTWEKKMKEWLADPDNKD
jgi:hypothetical protein